MPTVKAKVTGQEETVYLLADSAEELAGAIDHYAAQGFEVKSQGRRASGESAAVLTKGK
jgi:hypothetical protein